MLELGCATLDELLSRVGNQENLLKLIAFRRIEKKGSRADDFRWGTLCAAVGGGNWYDYFPGYMGENRPLPEEAPEIPAEFMEDHIASLKALTISLNEIPD